MWLKKGDTRINLDDLNRITRIQRTVEEQNPHRTKIQYGLKFEYKFLDSRWSTFWFDSEGERADYEEKLDNYINSYTSILEIEPDVLKIKS
jgi:hypothetical protein